MIFLVSFPRLETKHPCTACSLPFETFNFGDHFYVTPIILGSDVFLRTDKRYPDFLKRSIM